MYLLGGIILQFGTKTSRTEKHKVVGTEIKDSASETTRIVGDTRSPSISTLCFLNPSVLVIRKISLYIGH